MKFLSKIKKVFSSVWRDLIKSKTKEKTREAFKKMGIFPVFGVINQYKLDVIKEMILESMAQYNHKKIYLIINTKGGNVLPSLQFYDLLKSLSTEKVGIVINNCMSSGLAILAGCDKKLSFKHSRFLFHGITHTGTFESTSSDLESKYANSLNEFKDITLKYDSILKESFLLSDDMYTKISNEGREFDKRIPAEEAKNLGVIDEIILKLPFSFNTKSPTL